MHILVTNDDGISAPGLLALAQELRKMGEVTVFAPDRNWSASGHAKTLHKPLRIHQVKLADGSLAFTSDGAPSDCVALALLGYIERPIDLVVSGINPNANIGQDLTYSGTVTAAIEAAIFGVPGIAVSLDLDSPPLSMEVFKTPARIARQLITQIMARGLPAKMPLNINIPHLPSDQIRGVWVTRQGNRVYRDQLIRREDPFGVPYYWIGGEPPSALPEEGSDYAALKAGYVSITPLQLSMTDPQRLEEMKAWEWKLELD